MTRVKRVIRLLALASAAWAMSGCSAIEVMHESAYCPGGETKEARLVADQAGLNALWARIQNSPQAGPAPAQDFGRRRVLFLAEATYPTAGYGLRLADDGLTVNQELAVLHVEAARPDGMAAQVITRPCLLLSLPGGEYRRIQVYDASGPLWSEVEVRPR